MGAEGRERHHEEIHANLKAWESKPLLRDIYAGFYDRIRAEIDETTPGRIVELGSGIGNLKQHLPESLASDLFPQPWLDLACDAYQLPFLEASISHVIVFDVFHHLRKPMAFLDEARRVLHPHGRLILFEPYISLLSSFAYGPFHPEPIAWRDPIDSGCEPDRSGLYYAAQGNATRIFFKRAMPEWSVGWKLRISGRYADLSYLLSGGLSRPAMYPRSWLPVMRRLDRILSAAPALFASRCLICLEKSE